MASCSRCLIQPPESRAVNWGQEPQETKLFRFAGLAVDFAMESEHLRRRRDVDGENCPPVVRVRLRSHDGCFCWSFPKEATGATWFGFFRETPSRRLAIGSRMFYRFFFVPIFICGLSLQVSVGCSIVVASKVSMLAFSNDAIILSAKSQVFFYFL